MELKECLLFGFFCVVILAPFSLAESTQEELVNLKEFKRKCKEQENKEKQERIETLGKQKESEMKYKEQIKKLEVKLEESVRKCNEQHIKLKEKQQQIEKLEFFEVRFYRVNVILDPSTAHPRLEVSEDGKRVRDSGEVLKVPNNEERFDSHMFVLAKEGFVKGKHYWEVEVGQKTNWDLGVASESICRKGKIILAPKKGYWVIGLDGEKDYWARTDPWTRLEVSGKPTKIGMFLNMPERSLTFYDVNRRTKLHTSTLPSFAEKLYPFFSIGSVTVELDSHPLKIPPWFKE